MEFKRNRIHTYSCMIREAILYIAPDTDEKALAHMTKAQLRDLYCTIKDHQTRKDLFCDTITNKANNESTES